MNAITDARSLDQIGSALVGEVLALNLPNPLATLQVLAAIYQGGVSIADLTTLDAWLSRFTVPGTNPPVSLTLEDRQKSVAFAEADFGIEPTAPSE